MNGGLIRCLIRASLQWKGKVTDRVVPQLEPRTIQQRIQARRNQQQVTEGQQFWWVPSMHTVPCLCEKQKNNEAQIRHTNKAEQRTSKPRHKTMVPEGTKVDNELVRDPNKEYVSP
jgi:hypothetical protein